MRFDNALLSSGRAVMLLLSQHIQNGGSLVSSTELKSLFFYAHIPETHFWFNRYGHKYSHNCAIVFGLSSAPFSV
jgi:hypothetical protein